MIRKEEPSLINLNNKIFKAISNSENGEVDESTFFYYYQKDDMIWADYSGENIVKGHLIGKQLKNDKFDFVYHHVNLNGEIKIGKCLSKAEIIDNGRVKLFEKWQWLCDDMSSGESELEETTRTV